MLALSEKGFREGPGSSFSMTLIAWPLGVGRKNDQPATPSLYSVDPGVGPASIFLREPKRTTALPPHSSGLCVNVELWIGNWSRCLACNQAPNEAKIWQLKLPDRQKQLSTRTPRSLTFSQDWRTVRVSTFSRIVDKDSGCFLQRSPSCAQIHRTPAIVTTRNVLAGVVSEPAMQAYSFQNPNNGLSRGFCKPDQSDEEKFRKHRR